MNIQTGGRQILIHGLALILAGLLWGFVPPMTPFPRLALGAYNQFEVNGLLFMAVGILLAAKQAGARGRSTVARTHRKALPYSQRSA
jgi:hypothetical protein